MNRASGLHASLGSQTTPPVDPSLARQQRSPGSWFQGAEPIVVGVCAGTERCEDRQDRPNGSPAGSGFGEKFPPAKCPRALPIPPPRSVLALSSSRNAGVTSKPPPCDLAKHSGDIVLTHLRMT